MDNNSSRLNIWLLYAGCWCILLVACQSGPEQGNAVTIMKANASVDVPYADSVHKSNAPQLLEYFVDSLTIGKPGYHKAELFTYTRADTSYVVIRFFSRQATTWTLRNSFEFSKDRIRSCDPQVSDFTHDGRKDMTYISMVAARGSNEVRRLFIYDAPSDSFVYIRNSEDYPNMRYNQTLDCIDAFLVYGGCSTEFARIQGDSLYTFASVTLFEGLTVTEYDKNGKAHILQRDAEAVVDDYIRYKNYKPLVELEE